MAEISLLIKMQIKCCVISGASSDNVAVQTINEGDSTFFWTERFLDKARSYLFDIPFPAISGSVGTNTICLNAKWPRRTR